MLVILPYTSPLSEIVMANWEHKKRFSVGFYRSDVKVLKVLRCKKNHGVSF